MQTRKYENDFLIHSGRKGMKWGIQNGPPYPLDASPKTLNAKRFGMSAAKADLIRAGRQILWTIADPTGLVRLALSAKDLTIAGKNAIDTMKTRKDYDQNGVNTKVQNASFKKIQNEHTKEEDMKAINPDYGKAGQVNNCMLCTTAYDMRQRGYDVKAGKSLNGFAFDQISKWYKNPIMDKFNEKNWKSVEKTMIGKYPDGARGNLGIVVNTMQSWGGAHSVVWERSGDQIIIRDCQINKTYPMSKMSDVTWASWEVMSCRLDNLKPNMKVIGQYLTDA